jgi:hypothetical protein
MLTIVVILSREYRGRLMPPAEKQYREPVFRADVAYAEDGFSCFIAMRRALHMMEGPPSLA